MPLEGIALRTHPDRAVIAELLQDLRLPLVAAEQLLDLVGGHELPAAVQEALLGIAENTRHAAQLVADYQDISSLESGAVVVQPRAVAPAAWIARLLAPLFAGAVERQLEVDFAHRSLLPDIVEFDDAIAARAFEAVARTALSRAVPGPLRVRVRYMPAANCGQLEIDVETRGGGFQELDQGYIFVPFCTRDQRRRPVLGLTVARRLCGLLGGELCVESPGPEACSYRLRLAAPMTRGALWIDPAAPGTRVVGCAMPGRALLVGATGPHVRGYGAALRRSGHQVDVAATPGDALSRLAATPDAFDLVMLVEAAAATHDIPGALAAVRAAGHGRLLAVIANGGPWPAADVVAGAAVEVGALLRELDAARLRLRQRDFRNATSAS